MQVFTHELIMTGRGGCGHTRSNDVQQSVMRYLSGVPEIARMGPSMAVFEQFRAREERIIVPGVRQGRQAAAGGVFNAGIDRVGARKAGPGLYRAAIQDRPPTVEAIADALRARVDIESKC